MGVAYQSIARHFSTDFSVFHINSTKEVRLDWLIETVNSLGFNISILDHSSFTPILQANETVLGYLINDIDENGKLSYGNNIHVLNDFTSSYLKQFGFEWAEINFNYIKNYVDYFRKLGYFEVP